MSTQPVMPLSPSILSASSAQQSSALSVAGMSINGPLLFLIGFLVLASGFTGLRPEVMGLALHPYLAPLGLAFPLVVMARIHLFPMRVLVALLSFTAIYSISVFNGASIAVGEIVKTVFSVITIITCALLVRRRGDFVAGALGLSIAIALLAANGLREPTKLGVDAMQGANKNSYSLFALPAMLLAGYIALHLKTVPVAVKTALIACTVPALVAIFMSGNRSGYLGAAVVGLMLFWDQRGKGMLLVGMVALVVAFGITRFGSTEVFDERMKQTMEGNKSDDHRKDILIACFQIGMENPIIGISPQQLPIEVGRLTSIKHSLGLIEAHNAFMHVFASSGWICFAAMISIGWTLYFWKPRGGGKVGGADDPLRDARKLVRMLVILWVVRGMFTREIIYNPSCNIALGLAIGLCMLAEQIRKPVGIGSAKSQPPYSPVPGAISPGIR